MCQIDKPQHGPNKQNNPSIEPRNRIMRSENSKNGKHVFEARNRPAQTPKMSNPQLKTLFEILFKLESIFQN